MANGDERGSGGRTINNDGGELAGNSIVRLALNSLTISQTSHLGLSLGTAQ